MACALSLMTIASCDWFVLDNQDGYNASVYGNIVDSKTGAPIQQSHGDGFSIYEKVSGGQKYIGRDWSAETAQSWTMKSNGTYVNRLVFAGDYYFSSLHTNFICDNQDFVIKEGENKLDFKATPYVRITDFNVTFDGSKIKATCKVETDLAESVVNNIGSVRLLCDSDIFFSNGLDHTPDATAKLVNVDPKSGATLSFEIDTKNPANAEFKYKQAHFLRIAAIGAHFSVVPAWTEIVETMDWSSPLIDWAAVMTGDFSSVPVVKYEIEHPAEYKNDGQSNTDNKYNYSEVYQIDENGNVSLFDNWGPTK